MMGFSANFSSASSSSSSTSPRATTAIFNGFNGAGTAGKPSGMNFLTNSGNNKPSNYRVAATGTRDKGDHTQRAQQLLKHESPAAPHEEHDIDHIESLCKFDWGVDPKPDELTSKYSFEGDVVGTGAFAVVLKIRNKAGGAHGYAATDGCSATTTSTNASTVNTTTTDTDGSEKSQFSALKILQNEEYPKRGILHLLNQEMDAMRFFFEHEHENVMGAKEVYQTEEHTFLLMELLDTTLLSMQKKYCSGGCGGNGKNLPGMAHNMGKMMRSSGPRGAACNFGRGGANSFNSPLMFTNNNGVGVPEHIAKNWILQLLHGVHHLHSNNWVHRDLKLDNLLYDCDRDTVKICDFGWACQVSGSSTSCSSSTTSTHGAGALSSPADHDPPHHHLAQQSRNEMCGTPNWNAPEVGDVKQYPWVHWQKADVYTIGVVFFTLLQNQVYNCEDVKQEQILLSGYLTTGSSRRSNLSDGAKSFLITCLQKNPGRRPFAVAELIQSAYFFSDLRGTATAPSAAVRKSASATHHAGGGSSSSSTGKSAGAASAGNGSRSNAGGVVSGATGGPSQGAAVKNPFLRTAGGPPHGLSASVAKNPPPVTSGSRLSQNSSALSSTRNFNRPRNSFGGHTTSHFVYNNFGGSSSSSSSSSAHDPQEQTGAPAQRPTVTEQLSRLRPKPHRQTISNWPSAGFLGGGRQEPSGSSSVTSSSQEGHHSPRLEDNSTSSASSSRKANGAATDEVEHQQTTTLPKQTQTLNLKQSPAAVVSPFSPRYALSSQRLKSNTSQAATPGAGVGSGGSMTASTPHQLVAPSPLQLNQVNSSLTNTANPSHCLNLSLNSTISNLGSSSASNWLSGYNQMSLNLSSGQNVNQSSSGYNASQPSPGASAAGSGPVATDSLNPTNLLNITGGSTSGLLMSSKTNSAVGTPSAHLGKLNLLNVVNQNSNAKNMFNNSTSNVATPTAQNSGASMQPLYARNAQHQKSSAPAANCSSSSSSTSRFMSSSRSVPTFAPMKRFQPNLRTEAKNAGGAGCENSYYNKADNNKTKMNPFLFNKSRGVARQTDPPEQNVDGNEADPVEGFFGSGSGGDRSNEQEQEEAEQRATDFHLRENFLRQEERHEEDVDLALKMNQCDRPGPQENGHANDPATTTSTATPTATTSSASSTTSTVSSLLVPAAGLISTPAATTSPASDRIPGSTTLSRSSHSSFLALAAVGAPTSPATGTPRSSASGSNGHTAATSTLSSSSSTSSLSKLLKRGSGAASSSSAHLKTTVKKHLDKPKALTSRKVWSREPCLHVNRLADISEEEGDLGADDVSATSQEQRGVAAPRFLGGVGNKTNLHDSEATDRAGSKTGPGLPATGVVNTASCSSSSSSSRSPAFPGGSAGSRSEATTTYRAAVDYDDETSIPEEFLEHKHLVHNSTSSISTSSKNYRHEGGGVPPPIQIQNMKKLSPTTGSSSSSGAVSSATSTSWSQADMQNLNTSSREARKKHLMERFGVLSASTAEFAPLGATARAASPRPANVDTSGGASSSSNTNSTRLMEQGRSNFEAATHRKASASNISVEEEDERPKGRSSASAFEEEDEEASDIENQNNPPIIQDPENKYNELVYEVHQRASTSSSCRGSNPASRPTEDGVNMSHKLSTSHAHILPKKAYRAQQISQPNIPSKAMPSALSTSSTSAPSSKPVLDTRSASSSTTATATTMVEIDLLPLEQDDTLLEDEDLVGPAVGQHAEEIEGEHDELPRMTSECLLPTEEGAVVEERQNAGQPEDGLFLEQDDSPVVAATSALKFGSFSSATTAASSRGAATTSAASNSSSAAFPFAASRNKNSSSLASVWNKHSAGGQPLDSSSAFSLPSPTERERERQLQLLKTNFEHQSTGSGGVNYAKYDPPPPAAQQLGQQQLQAPGVVSATSSPLEVAEQQQAFMFHQSSTSLKDNLLSRLNQRTQHGLATSMEFGKGQLKLGSLNYPVYTATTTTTTPTPTPGNNTVMNCKNPSSSMTQAPQSSRITPRHGGVQLSSSPSSEAAASTSTSAVQPRQNQNPYMLASFKNLMSTSSGPGALGAASSAMKVSRNCSPLEQQSSAASLLSTTGGGNAALSHALGQTQTATLGFAHNKTRASGVSLRRQSTPGIFRQYSHVDHF
ncbi:unnamed protein product [Amoebophrya sp. A120]|nr:unnamed protein product [Amoebophrya sp. A120]|eukprot:GSA120T00010737001.1